MFKQSSNLHKFLLVLLVTCATSTVSAMEQMLTEMFRSNFPPNSFTECAKLSAEERSMLIKMFVAPLSAMIGARHGFGPDGISQVQKATTPLLKLMDAVINDCVRTTAAETAIIKADSATQIARIKARGAVFMVSPNDVVMVKAAQAALRHASMVRAEAIRSKRKQDEAIASFPVKAAGITFKMLTENSR